MNQGYYGNDFSKFLGAVKDQFVVPELGNLFSDANPLFRMATGQSLSVGDETGTASILPGGQFTLAGKYSTFKVNTFMREVSESLTNKKENLTVGGSFGMGPEGAYDPTVRLNIRAGDPLRISNRINIQGLPEEPIADQSPYSVGRQFMNQTVENYRNQNPFYYRGGVGY